MIEVLHVVSSLDTGGVETLLLNYYKNIDRKKIHFSFVFPADKLREQGMCEKKLIELGATIHLLPRRKPNFIGHLWAYYKFLKESTIKFDIVHSHLDEMNSFYLGIAAMLGIRQRISHCHIAFTERGIMKEFVCSMARPILKFTCTQKFACSKTAGEFLYGDDNNVFVMKNAIDVDKFKFDKNLRNTIRARYAISSDDVIIGCVARFYYQKNHERLINIFSEYHKKNPNSYLMLVGNGPLENDIKKQLCSLNLSDRAVFTGMTANVEHYLNAFDSFVLPTRFEGLGIVYIESQVNNLPTFATKERVPEEVAISPFMNFISESAADYEWAECIEKVMQDNTKRCINSEYAEKEGYEIKSAARILTEIYVKLYADEIK